MENNEGIRWQVRLIGGVKRRGAWRVSRHMVAVSTIGGVNADVTHASFDTPNPILTKISLVGCVSITVPDDVDVEVEGFQLIGGNTIEQPRRTGPATRTLRVRNYGLFGGVRVNRSTD